MNDMLQLVVRVRKIHRAKRALIKLAVALARGARRQHKAWGGAERNPRDPWNI